MGSKKRSKKSNPSNKAYIAENRMTKNKARKLSKHLKHQPNDKQSQKVLDKLK